MSTFVMECPFCRRLVEADEPQIGSWVVCPYCRQTIEVQRPLHVKSFHDDGSYPKPNLPEGNVAPGVWIVR